jgi:hypothetical protein
MKKAIALAVALVVSVPAWSECYLRSSTINNLKGKIEKSADQTRRVFPLNNNQLQCTVTFQVMIDGVWYSAQGDAVGAATQGDNQLCAQAQDIGRAHLLQKIEGSQTSVSQEMVCTDQDIPKWKPVNVGDIVRESEVAPHWDQRKRADFDHAGTKCRWFMETAPYRTGGMVQSYGVMCRLNKTDNNSWLIRDKWIGSVDK